ncbi:hypothetical protein [Polaribacter sp. Q13]|uniref:hypothetical protein n=1 Tax=Polaribacter sp. Q13 TaxID=2806551 RepID=UPI00193C07E9|nr:hypothetical protein [Polaribacter sp. Q13]QVY64844.1 hypothetical protein JOP69_13875 [Polaribacter sp. Q13]
MAFQKVLKKGFYFAIKNTNNTDKETALTAIILASICSYKDTKIQKEFKHLIKEFEKKRTEKVNLKNLQLLLQYAIVYFEVNEEYPKGLKNLIIDYYKVLSSEKITKELLPSFLLLTTANKQHISSKHVPFSLKIASNFTTMTKKEIGFLLNEIEQKTYHGLISITNRPLKLITILEAFLIIACSDYNLQQVSRILNALSYVNAPNSLAINTALTFLTHNQSTIGFIGYYEKEFSSLEKNQKVNEIGIQLSSTLQTISAMLTYKTGFRFYTSLGKNDKQKKHEMELIQTSIS